MQQYHCGGLSEHFVVRVGEDFVKIPHVNTGHDLQNEFRFANA